MKSFFKAVLYVAVFGYLFAAVAAFFFQRSLLYFPGHVDAKGEGNTVFKPLRSGNGEFLGYVRAPEGFARRVVILFHGNAGEALDRTWLAPLIPYADVVLILAEYPGYGARAGSPSESANVQAAKHLVQFARETWKAPVTLIGESLGTGVAASVAKEPGVDRLALISPFTSIQELAQAMFPWLPMELLLRDRYLSAEHLKDASVPLYVIHGTVDNVVPFASGQGLFKEYGGATKTFKALEGVSHNDIVPHLLTDPEAEEFRAFVRTG